MTTSSACVSSLKLTHSPKHFNYLAWHIQACFVAASATKTETNYNFNDRSVKKKFRTRKPTKRASLSIFPDTSRPPSKWSRPSWDDWARTSKNLPSLSWVRRRRNRNGFRRRRRRTKTPNRRTPFSTRRSLSRSFLPCLSFSQAGIILIKHFSSSMASFCPRKAF